MLVSYVLLSQFLTNISLKNENIVKISNDEKVKMEYALVNEDLGANFEGKRYALGSDFVTLINQDSQNRWETTSRNIADAGIESGQFDAKIIIPQNFSENILSLQSISPEKAMIEYQVREGQNAISNQQIQEQVNLILRDFNQRVVQMYFSSVISNLSEAQLNVNEIIEEDSGSHTNLQTKIQTPFKELPGNFTTVLDTTSILSEENKIFDIEQKAFVSAISDLMESNNSELESQIQTTKTTKESISSYTEEANKKIEESIEQFNEQFELHKKQLGEQWDLDLADYKGQYDTLNQSAKAQLIQFSGVDESGNNIGLLPDLLEKTKEFETNQKQTQGELNKSIKAIETEIEKLRDLQVTIGETFFDDLFKDETISIDILNSEEQEDKKLVKEKVDAAVEKLITSSNHTSNLNKSYLNAVNDSLQKLPLTDLESLLNLLDSNSEYKTIIGPDNISRLKKEIAIIKKYQLDFGKPAGNGPLNFKYFNGSQSGEHTVTPLIENKATFNISLVNETRIKLSSIDNSQSINFDLDKKTVMENQINSYLNSKNYSSNVNITEKEIVIDKPQLIGSTEPETGTSDSDSTASTTTATSESETTESSSSSTEDSSTETTSSSTESSSPSPVLPKELAITFDLALLWNLNSNEKKNQYNTIKYALSMNGENQFSSSYAIFDNFNLDSNLKEDIPKLLKQFALLDTTSQQIITLFGSPNEESNTLTVDNFHKFIGENGDKKLNDISMLDSVYNLYNNNLNINQLIIDSISTEFMSKGKEIYQSIDDSLIEIIKIKKSQKQTVKNMLSPEFFIENIEAISNWHQNANLKINETYNSWKESNQVTPESIITSANPHPEVNDTKMIDSETESLIKSIETLVTTSKEASKLTVESAAKVKDIKPITEEVLTTTKEVQKKADTILVDLNATVTKAQEDIEKNQLYAQGFSKVMANTKNGNSDNTKVYDFLSSPISGSGTLGKTRQVSLIPYYATIIGMVLSIILSVALQYYMRSRKIRQDQLLINQSIIWKNMPNVLVIIGSTLIFSIFYGLSIVTNLESSIRTSMFIYAALFFISSSILITGCMRFSRNMTLYTCAIVISIYFMLTPLIGVETKQGSLVNLLYKLSPLQNVQNGYTILINKVSLNWYYYAIFVFFIISGVIINFLSSPESIIKNKESVEGNRSLL